jgi:hypothetical protein
VIANLLVVEIFSVAIINPFLFDNMIAIFFTFSGDILQNIVAGWSGILGQRLGIREM